MDGDRDKDPHWSTWLSSQCHNQEQKEEEQEKGSRDHWGCDHPLRRWDRSNGRSSRPVGMVLMEDVFNPDSLNVADSGGWLRSQGQLRWALILLHGQAFWEACKFGCLPNSLFEATVILIPKPCKCWMKKEIYRTSSLMNMDAKILNRKQANQIQEYIKKVNHCDQICFISETQSWINIWKSTNIVHHMNTLKKNLMVISLDAEKSFDKIQHPFIIKVLKQLGI